MKKKLSTIFAVLMLMTAFNGCSNNEVAQKSETELDKKDESKGTSEKDNNEDKSETDDSKPEESPEKNMDDFTIVDGVLTEYKGTGTEVIIPKGVTAIGDRVFECRYELIAVTIPDSVTSVGCNAFDDTPWLNNQTDEFVIVGDGVLLKYCGNGGNVTLPDTVKYIGDAFPRTKPTNVIIPDSVSAIGDYAFYGCESLVNIAIPNSVTSIGDYAFCGCSSLADVTIPNSVISISADAFYGCESLTSITYNGSTYSDIDRICRAING